MKKKSMLTALVMLSLLQGSVYAENLYGDGNPLVVNKGETYDNIYGVGKEDTTGNVSGGSVEVNGGTWNYIFGGYTKNGSATNNNVTIVNVEKDADHPYYQFVVGAQVENGDIKNNTVNINNELSTQVVSQQVLGAKLNDAQEGTTYEVSGNTVNINGGIVLAAGAAAAVIQKENSADMVENVDVRVINNTLNVKNASVLGQLIGAASNNYVSDTVVTLDENSIVEGFVVAGGGLLDKAVVSSNDIKLTSNANVSEAYMNGYYIENTLYKNPVTHSDNSLIVDGWTGQKIAAVNYFDDIEFKNFEWDTTKTRENALVVISQDSNLSETDININRDNDGKNGIKLSNGQTINTGDSMTLIYSANGLGDIAALEGGKEITTNLGVATALDAVIEQSEDKNSVNLTAKEVKLADQTMLVAENRAVAAAFVNQGTDLIADSLDTLSRDGKYGVKTFAAVHGNRSKYDVNSDIKINGWSTIVGVGAENEHHGGDFSWGVFYENGSGNYRTFNSFNNEYFRGDGSLVYNGGGIAARYENAHGVYTEGSFRAGMLKSDMDNALSDGENKYGYSSESEYYGAHIGIGQIIPLSESSDLDVYGKFFHTYTEGDSFNVAGDEFEFDGINSDRLRVGARLTTNKENKFSTYYGLAYEYEFNGDAEMRAAGMNAPTQSLQGSSYMAEVGFNYQPTPESPWSFDLNMRGYAGERQGGSFNVQATYTF